MRFSKGCWSDAAYVALDGKNDAWCVMAAVSVRELGIGFQWHLVHKWALIRVVCFELSWRW